MRKQILEKLKKFLPKKEHGLVRKAATWLGLLLVGLFALSLISFIGLVGIISVTLPDVTNLENLQAAQSTEIYDREGNLLYTIHGDENREYVEYDDISSYLVNATVAIEDVNFWEHKGFDLMAIGKALMYEIFGIGTPRGGSTITQQYVKNAFLSPEHSYLRKAKELILAIRLERAYDKKKIMELYLNRIPYGNNAYGAQKAAEIYFGKTAKDLDLAQSVVLASLPQAPSKYNPYGNNRFSHLLKQFTPEELFYRNIEKESDLVASEYARGLIGSWADLGNGTKIYLTGRTDLVLRQMVKLGDITADEQKQALNELQTMVFNKYQESIKYPHFVLYIKQELEDKYGKDIVENGGFKVYTTIDPKIQDYAEQVAKEKGDYYAENFGANNLAILTINAKTGQILAMVGSRDYFNEEIDGMVNVVFRPRQPGSSFKPIVYAQAFYNGYAPGNVIYDVPTKVGSDTPMDFDGRWRGQMSIREALGQSRNIPAIKAYFLAGGQDPIIDLANKMGILSLKKSHSYGYPLALGAGEVPVSEMVTAYATFATGGKKPELTGILKIENIKGDVLEEWHEKEFPEVLDPQIAYCINSVLSDRSVAIGPAIFVDGKTNAAKTGTSTKETKKGAVGLVRPGDNWTVGYTPTIVTGVWVGNSDGSGLGMNADGYNTAGPIFKLIMTKALEDLSDEQFVRPEGVKDVQISKASGKLPGLTTPSDMIVSDVFPSFSVPTEVDESFFKVKIDKVSGLLATEYTPSDAVEEVLYQNYQPIAPMFNWANEIRAYYEKRAAEEGQTGLVRMGVPPTEYDNVHTAEAAARKPSISIIDPVSHSSISMGSVTVEIDMDAPNGVQSVEYYIDDKKEYSTGTAPYFGNLIFSKFKADGLSHLIVAKVIDKLGYSAQSAIEVKVTSDVGGDDDEESSI